MRQVLAYVRKVIPLICCLVALVLGPVTAARAQSYDISWYKVSGGGGTSAGGAYSVTGTIGQADAGTLSGGSYTLTGGFWGIIATVQVPGSPPLTIVGVTTNQVMLAWPASYAGFRIQQDSSVGNTNWLNLNTNSYSITVTNGSNRVTLPVSGGNQFFRLVSP